MDGLEGGKRKSRSVRRRCLSCKCKKNDCKCKRMRCSRKTRRAKTPKRTRKSKKLNLYVTSAGPEIDLSDAVQSFPKYISLPTSISI